MEADEHLTADSHDLQQDSGNQVASQTVQVEHVPQPKLSLFQTCSIVISSVGGVGIFVAMSTMMTTTGSVGVMLIIVLVSGLLNYSLANCFTEVAVMLPKAGGPYFFIFEVFGGFPAFLFIWGFMFMIIAPAWAYLGYASSLYIVQLFFPGCRPPDVAVKLLAACILVLAVLINCMYLKYVTKIQALLTSTKLVASVFVVICGVFSVAQGNIENYRYIFEGSTTEPGDIAVSILSGMFLYGGWQMITFLLEEMDTPEKNLPRTLSISFVIVIILSELIVASYFTLISPAEMVEADAVAVLFMERVHPAFGAVIAVFVTTSSIAGLNSSILAQSRMISAAAKRHHLPELLATYSDKYNMPWGATIYLSIVAILILFFGKLSELIIMVSFYATVMGLSVLLCLFALRIKRPRARRPVRVWLGTAIVQLLINATTLIMSIYQQPRNIGTLVLFVLCGIPVYFVCIHWRSKPKVIGQSIDRITIFLQKLLLLKKD